MKYFLLFLLVSVSCNTIKLKDITADNYKELGLNLKQTISSNSGLGTFSRAHIFGPPIKFSDSDLIYYKFNISNIGTGIVEYYDMRAGITYILIYSKNALESLLLIAGSKEALMDSENSYIPRGDEMVNEALRDHQYLYSKTKLIEGNDILIKEFPKHFLIGEIHRNDRGQIVTILFRCWNKKKTNK